MQLRPLREKCVHGFAYERFEEVVTLTHVASEVFELRELLCSLDALCDHPLPGYALALSPQPRPPRRQCFVRFPLLSNRLS